LFAVFLCFLICIPNAFATPMAGDTIVLTRTDTVGGTGGGEFWAKDTDSADDLQIAIWDLQGQRSVADNYLVKLAKDSGWDTIGNVRIMNIVKTDGSKRQDQQTLVPEPTTIVLSGLGLVFMGVFFRRRFIK
jgi:hypothetical protein